MQYNSKNITAFFQPSFSVIIELFSLGVVGEVLQANIDWKLAFFKGVGQFGPKFQVEETSTTNHLCTVRYTSKCPRTLLLKVFTQRNFVADFLQNKSNFIRKTATLCFQPPLGGGVRGNVWCPS